MDTLVTLLVLLAALAIVRTMLRSPGVWFAAMFVLACAGLFAPAIFCLVIGFVTHLATPPRGTG